MTVGLSTGQETVSPGHQDKAKNAVNPVIGSACLICGAPAFFGWLRVTSGDGKMEPSKLRLKFENLQMGINHIDNMDTISRFPFYSRNKLLPYAIFIR